MNPETSGKNSDAIYYVLSIFFAAWGLAWIIGLLRITH
jgi:hypothetical protein